MIYFDCAKQQDDGPTFTGFNTKTAERK